LVSQFNNIFLPIIKKVLQKKMTSTIKFIGKKTVHCTLFFHIAREARSDKTVEGRKKIFHDKGMR